MQGREISKDQLLKMLGMGAEPEPEGSEWTVTPIPDTPASARYLEVDARSQSRPGGTNRVVVNPERVQGVGEEDRNGDTVGAIMFGDGVLITNHKYEEVRDAYLAARSFAREQDAHELASKIGDAVGKSRSLV